MSIRFRLRRAFGPTVQALAVVVAMGAAGPAAAADWIMSAGTEEGRPVGITGFGITQLLVESTPWAQPITGLKAPPLQRFNGSYLASDIDDALDLSVRRARFGVRGTIPATDDRITFFVSVEAGTNGFTRDRGISLADASMSFRLLPGLRLRLGQFKLPTADEAIESNPVAAAFTRFSPAVSALLNEQDVEGGHIVGPTHSFRDLGLQAFDAIPLWDGETTAVEVTYAAMVSAGRPLHTIDDVDAAIAQFDHVLQRGPDLTGRLQLSWVLDAAHRHKAIRDEVAVWAWRQQGSRVVVDHDVARVRQGAGAHVAVGGVRVRGEVIAASGAVLAPAPFAGMPTTILDEGEAIGGSLDLAVGQIGQISLAPFVIDTSLDWLERNPGDPAASRFLQTITVGTQVRLSRVLRLMVNAQFRHQEAGPAAPPDAGLIAASTSPLLSTQLNLVF